MPPKFKIKYKGPKPSDSPGFLLWRAHNAWQREIRSVLKPLGLTHVQFVLMAGITWLESREDVITQRMLAEFIEADVMMTSVVLRALEDKQLIERKTHPKDPRAKCINLTSEGMQLITKAAALISEFDTHFFGQISAPNLQSLTEELSTISQLS